MQLGESLRDQEILYYYTQKIYMAVFDFIFTLNPGTIF